MPRDGAKACADRYWSRGKREACAIRLCSPGVDDDPVDMIDAWEFSSLLRESFLNVIQFVRNFFRKLLSIRVIQK